MVHITADFYPKVHWTVDYGTQQEGIKIEATYFNRYTEKEAAKQLKQSLKENECKWLYSENNKWFIDLKLLKQELKVDLPEFLLQKVYPIDYGVLNRDSSGTSMLTNFSYTTIIFTLTPEDIKMLEPKKIFLSHKSDDKTLVRNFKRTLETLNYSPWLDEDELPAGSQLNRGLLQGFKDSCAAIFFITPKFKDEKYLEAEIDHAITQKRERGNRFSIITLVLKDDEGNVGKVPDQLDQYIWKMPSNDLDALREIIRALPITTGAPYFKEDVH